MATIEQCRACLQENLKTKDDVCKFADDLGGGVVTNASWNDHQFITENIAHFVDKAHRAGHLDNLGIKLGLPSNAEATRIAAKEASSRAVKALIISLAALIVSVISLCNNR